ncbi:MAG: hypothetical protein ABI221_01180 [Candidatus Saccharimonadales bacterium]
MNSPEQNKETITSLVTKRAGDVACGLGFLAAAGVGIAAFETGDLVGLVVAMVGSAYAAREFHEAGVTSADIQQLRDGS